MDQRFLIDAREFLDGRRTGIGRFLEGLTDALAESGVAKEILLAVSNPDVLPPKLKTRKGIRVKSLPVDFLKCEKTLADLTKDQVGIFISPYPKLPLFGCHCLAVHTIHDILDLTHPAYSKRLKVFFDTFRLKRALSKADLTWYVSSWSKNETKQFVGCTGKNPRVRYQGINEKFNTERKNDERNILKKYEIKPGYILVIGNGRPHKNLGVLLEISNHIAKQLVIVGVSQKNQQYWKLRFPGTEAVWIEHIIDEELPAILKGAFCLAHPSSVEGYGYPPLEAMACGVPAVVSNIPVLLETTGGNSLTADTEDPKKWVEAFKVLENKKIYQNQIKMGLKWVEPLAGQNGWKNFISDIEELMKGILYEKGINHWNHRPG